MTIYCNHMGMLLEFSYCIEVNTGLPCRNIIGCWSGRMDIIAFLKERFSPADLERILGGPHKSRIDRIMEVLED
ncbi:MAG: hypothetical protein AB1442_01125 [Nitrospirota bacterium]